MSTWEQQCPLAGTCSECGLEFQWWELLNPRLSLPKWLVECAISGRWFLRRVLGTWWRCGCPWRFWSQVKMSHPLNVSRLLAYVGLLAAGLYLCFALCHGLRMWMEWSDYLSWGGSQSTASGWEVFSHAAIMPFSSTSIGAFTSSGQRWPIPPPSDGMLVWNSLAYPIGVLLAFPIAAGLTFAALPISRKRAQVRWRHIVRVTAYAYGLYVIPLELSMLAPALSPVTMTPIAKWLAWAALISWLITAVWMLLWWTFATSRYLRMPHAWAVSVCVSIVGLLAPFTLAVLFWVFIVQRQWL